jgi:hypothetical protein
MVLDLTDRKFVAGIGLSLTLLRAPWQAHQDAGREAVTQAIGRAACAAGFDGILSPSARRKGGVNLTMFPDNLGPQTPRPSDLQSVEVPEDLRLRWPYRGPK